MVYVWALFLRGFVRAAGPFFSALSGPITRGFTFPALLQALAGRVSDQAIILLQGGEELSVYDTERGGSTRVG